MKKLLTFIFISGLGQSASAYTHQVTLDVLAIKELSFSVNKIIQRTQGYFDKCQIKINLGKVTTLDKPEWKEWETYWFNSYNFSDQENSLTDIPFSKNPTLILVDSLNWTQEGQGTWAAAYAPFLLDQDNMPDPVFFKRYLLGKLVVGVYRAKWTVAHELGHLIMNLQHYQNGNNVMHTGVPGGEPQFDDDHFLISPFKPQFSKEQCEQGIKNSLYIKKINKAV